MYDASRSIAEFLDATAARQPIPGGGSVTALVGALSAAIGEMVVNYSLGRKDLAEYEGELRPALKELTQARKLMLALMVEDQLAYDTLSGLRKLPQDSTERAEKMPAALLACIRAPEAMAAAGAAVLEVCDGLVNFVNPYLLSDLAVCADLAMATLRCAIYNVRVNLKSVNEPDRAAIEARVAKILDRAVTLIQSVSPRIWDRDAQGA
jgi:formiminotetrahydrofolate cyclodeaminase